MQFARLHATAHSLWLYALRRQQHPDVYRRTGVPWLYGGRNRQRSCRDSHSSALDRGNLFHGLKSYLILLRGSGYFLAHVYHTSCQPRAMRSTRRSREAKHFICSSTRSIPVVSPDYSLAISLCYKEHPPASQCHMFLLHLFFLAMFASSLLHKQLPLCWENLSVGEH